MTDLLLLPGDGIGPEVTAQVRRVVSALDPDHVDRGALFGGSSYESPRQRP
jgi:3-isopropylmalate dehydrogenase